MLILALALMMQSQADMETVLRQPMDMDHSTMDHSTMDHSTTAARDPVVLHAELEWLCNQYLAEKSPDVRTAMAKLLRERSASYHGDVSNALSKCSGAMR